MNHMKIAVHYMEYLNAGTESCEVIVKTLKPQWGDSSNVFDET